MLEPPCPALTRAAKLEVLLTGGDVSCFSSCGDVCWWWDAAATAADDDVDDSVADISLRMSLMVSANVGVLLLKPSERLANLS